MYFFNEIFVKINLILIFIYYCVFFAERMKMKRDNHDDGPHSDKRSRRNDDQVRILIPSNVSWHKEMFNFI